MLEIQKFENEIKKGLPKPLYFCYTTESFFLFEASRIIRKYFPSIAIETYESAKNIDIKSFMASQSLFSEKRVAIIYNFEKIRETHKRIDLLNKMLINSSPSVKIVILSNASIKDLSQELDFLKKKNSVIYSLDINERQMSAWISYKAKEHGIIFKPDAIYCLIDIASGQPCLISSEIEKIALLTNKSEIGLFDIKDILFELGEYTAFELAIAIERKDKEETFKILEKLQNIEPDMILGALNWYYSNKTHGLSESERSYIYSLLYRTNLAMRQTPSSSIDILVYELLKI